MKLKAIVILIVIGIFLPGFSNAQLSDRALDEITQPEADKWSNYLNFSKRRKDKFKNILKDHEYNKSKIILTSMEVKDLLLEENERFINELGKILTARELNVYKMFKQDETIDSRFYLNSLLESVNLDEGYVEAYNRFQFDEVIPSLLTFRMDLENVLSGEDKIVLDSIRNEVIEVYDNCLIYCLNNASKDSTLFENLDDLLVVDINKNISDPNSALSKLINLTRKYNEDIDAIQAKHSDKFAYWKKKTTKLEDEYLLPNNVENLRKLKKDSEYASLAFLESEAIFLLLDPFNQSRSLKFLFIGTHDHHH